MESLHYAWSVRERLITPALAHQKVIQQAGERNMETKPDFSAEK